MTYPHATRWLIGIGAAGALLLGACAEGTAENGGTGGSTTSPTSTSTAAGTATATDVAGTSTEAPTETATAEASPTADPDVPATARPPALDASSGDASVPVGLGSYCWTPPEGSGQPGLCADAIGIVTASAALTAGPNAEVVLAPAEADALASATAITAQVWPRDKLGEPIGSGDWGVAWNPGEAQATVIEATLADGMITFDAPAEAGAYVIGLFVTFENGDAMYGLQLEVE